MHRNSYDNDNSTFSPQGRLHQVSRPHLGMTRLSPPRTHARPDSADIGAHTHTGRVCARGSQAGIGVRRPEEQDSRHPSRTQGTPRYAFPPAIRKLTPECLAAVNRRAGVVPEEAHPDRRPPRSRHRRPHFRRTRALVSQAWRFTVLCSPPRGLTHTERHQQQLYAHSGHVVPHAVQPATAHQSHRRSHRRQYVHGRVAPSDRVRLSTCLSCAYRGAGQHAALRPTTVRCRTPRRRLRCTSVSHLQVGHSYSLY